VGIDPGINGAVALFTDEFVNREVVVDLPTTEEGKHRELDYPALRDIFWAFRPEHVFLEIVNARPGRDEKTGEEIKFGNTSLFRFGGGFFAIKAVLGCLDIRPTMVASQSWKGHFGMRGGKASKEEARLLTIEKFPHLAEPLKRMKDHQRAEAYLIAAYGAYKLGHKDNALLPIPKKPKLVDAVTAPASKRRVASRFIHDDDDIPF
jgi:crossover junction endodeoxyribonuclease RuvC